MDIAKKVNENIKLEHKIDIPERLTELILLYLCIEIYKNEIENGDIFESVSILSKYIKWEN